MLLIYLDESGINYQKKDKFYVDGPYILWCGILVEESKYFHLERLYCELAKQIGIKDREVVEAHGTDIWAQKGNFTSLSKSNASKYFAELFQLLQKLDIKIVVGLNRKRAYPHWNKEQKKEKSNARYALLHGLEYRLSQLNETGIIISDNGDNIIDDLLFQRTRWRFNPGAKKKGLKKSAYEFESKSCFLLDRVHFMDSKKSFFLQIADQVTFVTNRVLTYCNLLYSPHPILKADKAKVPISAQVFAYCRTNILLAHFDESQNDVLFTDLALQDYDDRINYLPRIPDIFPF